MEGVGEQSEKKSLKIISTIKDTVKNYKSWKFKHLCFSFSFINLFFVCVHVCVQSNYFQHSQLADKQSFEWTKLIHLQD